MKQETNMTAAEALELGLVQSTGRVRRAVERERIAAVLEEQRAEEQRAFDAMTAEEQKPVLKLRERQKLNAEKRARRTKGKDYSRCRLVRTIPGAPEIGQPGAFVVEHPTRGRSHTISATEETMKVFMPSAPSNLRAAMLGRKSRA